MNYLLVADDSHEISSLTKFYHKIYEICQMLLSASVSMSNLRVNLIQQKKNDCSSKLTELCQ